MTAYTYSYEKFDTVDPRLRGDDGFPFITQRYDDLAAYATKKR